MYQTMKFNEIYVQLKVVIFGLQTFCKLPHQDLSVGIELYHAVILWPCARFNQGWQIPGLTKMAKSEFPEGIGW